MQPDQPTTAVSLIGQHGHQISVKGHRVEGECWFVINFDGILKARATVFLGLNLINEPCQIFHPSLSWGRPNWKPNYISFLLPKTKKRNHNIIANGPQIHWEPCSLFFNTCQWSQDYYESTNTTRLTEWFSLWGSLLHSLLCISGCFTKLQIFSNTNKSTKQMYVICEHCQSRLASCFMYLKGCFCFF